MNMVNYKYNFAEINAKYCIADVFTKLTDINTQPCGDNVLEPEDETCPLCGHLNCFRFYIDSNKGYCFSCCESLSVLDLIHKLGDYMDVHEAARALDDGNLVPATLERQPSPSEPVDVVEDNRDIPLIASILQYIAQHCHQGLLDNPEAMTYQTEKRGHREETLRAKLIGYTDGKLYQALKDKYPQEVLLSTGMFRLDANGQLRDFAPPGIYVYPHEILTQDPEQSPIPIIGRFTFKDPNKRWCYQQPKKCWLPDAALFYNMNSLNRLGDIAIVEGENDLLSLEEASYLGSILSTNGSISHQQIAEITTLAETRRVITFFDNDDAGDKYRHKLPCATHYVVPERGSDIDAHLQHGGSLEALMQTPTMVTVVDSGAEAVFTPQVEVIEPKTKGACGDEGFNDIGNANAFCRMHGDNLCYLAESAEFMHFTNQKWTPARMQIWEYAKQVAQAQLGVAGELYADANNEKDKAKADTLRLQAKEVMSHAGKLHSLPKLKAMIELAKPKQEVSSTVFNSNTMLFAVDNGVIDLRSGLCRENRRRDYISLYSPVQYDPLAVCPTWEKFIADIMLGDTEMIDFLQRMAGYFITGRVDEQLLFFFYGHGSNGKSTFINVMQNLTGPYATQLNSDALMANRYGSSGGPNASIAKLNGKRLVVSNELPENGRFDEVMLKSATGGDTLVARPVYGKQEIEFMAQFSLVIIGNHKPVIHDMSHGMWRRMCMIPFAAQFTANQIDPTLPDKLKAELPGILNWVIRGVQLWQQRPLKANLPQFIQDANAEYRAESDLLGEFLTECCVINTNGNGFTATADLYPAFKAYANEGNEWTMTQRTLTKKLLERGLEKTRYQNKYGFKGITLIDRELSVVPEGTFSHNISYYNRNQR